jgi:hypothetical protein
MRSAHLSEAFYSLLPQQPPLDRHQYLHLPFQQQREPAAEHLSPFVPSFGGLPLAELSYSVSGMWDVAGESDLLGGVSSLPGPSELSDLLPADLGLGGEPGVGVSGRAFSLWDGACAQQLIGRPQPPPILPVSAPGATGSLWGLAGGLGSGSGSSMFGLAAADEPRQAPTQPPALDGGPPKPRKPIGRFVRKPPPSASKRHRSFLLFQGSESSNASCSSALRDRMLRFAESFGSHGCAGTTFRVSAATGPTAASPTRPHRRSPQLLPRQSNRAPPEQPLRLATSQTLVRL